MDLGDMTLFVLSLEGQQPLVLGSQKCQKQIV